MLVQMRKHGIKAIMQIPREPSLSGRRSDRLAEIFGVPELAEDTHIAVRSNDGRQWDAVFAARGLSFVLEWKRSGSLGHVRAAAIRQLEMAKHSFPHEVIPLLAVPYMGQKQRRNYARRPNFLGWISQETRESSFPVFSIRIWAIPTASAAQDDRRAHSDQKVLG